MKKTIHLNYVGYWSHDYDDEITPSFLVGDFHEVQKRNIVKYLRSGIRGIEFQGYARCRFECNASYSKEMGNTDFSDGLWIWPEGLAHYVEAHNLLLPQTFISHMKESNFELKLPSSDFCAWFKTLEEQESFTTDGSNKEWLDWLKRMGETEYLKNPTIAEPHIPTSGTSSLDEIPFDWPLD